MTRRPLVVRRLAVAAVLPLALSGLASCGGKEPAPDAGAGATPAATPAATPSSAEEPQASSSSAGPGAHDADSILPAMQAAVEEAGSARTRMRMTGMASMRMDGRMAMAEEFDESEMELRVKFRGQRLDLRVVDGLVYVSGPQITPRGKWVAVDPQDPRDPLAGQFSSLAAGGNLSAMFDAFEAGLRDVEHVGQDRIDGEAVEHYVFTVDSQAAAAAQGQQVQPGMPEAIAYDVWLTEGDLIRRVRFDLGGVKAVMDATEWGEPVDVEPPAPADLVERPRG